MYKWRHLLINEWKISIESHGGQRENTFFIWRWFNWREWESVFLYSYSYFIYLFKIKKRRKKIFIFQKYKIKRAKKQRIWFSSSTLIVVVLIEIKQKKKEKGKRVTYKNEDTLKITIAHFDYNRSNQDVIWKHSENIKNSTNTFIITSSKDNRH